MNKDNIDVDLDKEEINEEVKEVFKDTDHIHIHKTGDDGEDVNVDIDKKNKTVNVNVDKEKDGKKTNVKIGISGIKVNKNGKDEVNIQFWPIFVFVAVLVSGFFFLIYKVVELIVRG